MSSEQIKKNMAPPKDDNTAAITKDPFGNRAPFAEPSWYNALASPYYNDSHRRVRDYARAYLEEHVVPHAHEWEEQGHVPDGARRHYARSGMAFQGIPQQYSAGVPLPGRIPPEGI